MTQKYLKSRWRSVVNGICMDEAGKRSRGIMNKGLANPFFFFFQTGKMESLSREYTLAIIDKSILKFFTSKVNLQN